MSRYMPTRKYKRKMKRSNLVGSCLLQVTAFAQLNCRLVKLLKTNQMWLKPLNFSWIGRKLWVKKMSFSFSSVFQSCLNYVKARLSCKGVMTIYQSQNIKVSPSMRLSGPSVLWFLFSPIHFWSFWRFSVIWLSQVVRVELINWMVFYASFSIISVCKGTKGWRIEEIVYYTGKLLLVVPIHSWSVWRVLSFSLSW